MTVTTYKVLKRFHKSLVRPHMSYKTNKTNLCGDLKTINAITLIADKESSGTVTFSDEDHVDFVSVREVSMRKVSMNDNLKPLEAKPEGRLKQLADSPYLAAVLFVVVVGLLFWVAFK